MPPLIKQVKFASDVERQEPQTSERHWRGGQVGYKRGGSELTTGVTAGETPETVVKNVDVRLCAYRCA